MTLNLQVPTIESQLSPRITVVGVGGAGGNAVNNMIQSNLEGVDFLVANTDAQALAQSVGERRVQLGRNVTQGLGAGSRPDVGRAAAEEALDDILAELEGTNMVFVTAGMGGGTGTGAAPVIARAAREAGMLTVGVITKPFHFEGVQRMRIAETGLNDLHQHVDTLIIIPNQNLFRVANEKTTFADAFKMADHVLYSGVRGVTDLMVMPGLINLDFADIRAVMTEMGKAMMGTGEASGEGRAVGSAEAAISNPLLDDVSMKGARGVLINISGGDDMTLFEVDEAANRIREEVDTDANIIFGSTFDSNLEGTMRISVVATGIEASEAISPRPVTLSLVSDRARSLAQESLADSPEPATDADDIAARIAMPDPTPAAPMAAGSEITAAVAPPARAAAMPESQLISAPATPTQAMMAQPSPVGAMRADASTEAFIAPQPAQPSPIAAGAAAMAPAPEPFAAAAMANASRQPAEVAQPVAQAAPQTAPIVAPAKRGRSLFARVTGAARSIQPQEAPAQQPVQAAPAATLNVATAPRMAAQAARQVLGLEAQGAPVAVQPATQAPAQPSPTQTAAQPAPAQPAAQPAPAQPAAQPAPAQPSAQPAAQPAVQAAEPPVAEAAPQAAAQPQADAPEAAPAAEGSQPQLAGLYSSDRPVAGQPEEDLLDIPAFLRRQAN